MLYPIVLVVIILFFFDRKGHMQRKKMQQTPLNNKIVKIKNNWQGEYSYNYITDNNIVISPPNKDTLKIGDSISKPANVKAFDVYRKNKDGQYEFFKHYDDE